MAWTRDLCTVKGWKHTCQVGGGCAFREWPCMPEMHLRQSEQAFELSQAPFICKDDIQEIRIWVLTKHLGPVRSVPAGRQCRESAFGCRLDSNQ